jgi:hypothetical protein
MTSALLETSPKNSLYMQPALLPKMKLAATSTQFADGSKESKLLPMMLPSLDKSQERTSATHQALLNGLNMLHTALLSWQKIPVNPTTASGLLVQCLCQTTTSALLIHSLKMPLLMRLASITLIWDLAEDHKDANGTANHQLQLLQHFQQQLPLELLQLHLHLQLLNAQFQDLLHTGMMKPALMDAQLQNHSSLYYSAIHQLLQLLQLTGKCACLKISLIALVQQLLKHVLSVLDPC